MNYVNEHVASQQPLNYVHPLNHPAFAASLVETAPVLTQFGEMVDVRKRGALRIMRLAGMLDRNLDTPAVVRLWHEEHCRELSSQQARRLANQLLAAADLADKQNQRE